MKKNIARTERLLYAATKAVIKGDATTKQRNLLQKEVQAWIDLMKIRIITEDSLLNDLFQYRERFPGDTREAIQWLENDYFNYGPEKVLSKPYTVSQFQELCNSGLRFFGSGCIDVEKSDADMFDEPKMKKD